MEDKKELSIKIKESMTYIEQDIIPDPNQNVPSDSKFNLIFNSHLI